jgi:pSer/pThr/pTyr-binding forkhead associated (FHA) protein
VRLKLRVIGGKNAGQHIEVQGERFIIGRAEGCHLRPTSELISRQHCVISVGQEGARVADLNSSNGTRVNGVPVRGDRALVSGDQLQIGPLVFEVVVVSSVEKIVPNATAEYTFSRNKSEIPRRGQEGRIAEFLTDGTANVSPPGTVEMKLDETHADKVGRTAPHSGLTARGVKQTTSESTRTMRMPALPSAESTVEIKDASDAASAAIGNIRSTFEKNKRRLHRRASDE